MKYKIEVYDLEKNKLRNVDYFEGEEAEAQAWVASLQAVEKPFGWGRKDPVNYRVEGPHEVQEDLVSKYIEVGKASQGLLDDITGYVAGYNILNNASSADKDNMETAYAPVYKAMEKKRPARAKKRIQEAEPFGIYNQGFKDGLLSIFTRYGV